MRRMRRQSLRAWKAWCYLNTTLNTGHAHGLAGETIILPVLARDEEPQPTTQESMFNYVRLSDGGPRRHEGPRSEVEITAQIAECVLGGSTPGSTDRLAVDAGHGPHSRRDRESGSWVRKDR